MSGTHTIFDTRRSNKDDKVTSEKTAKAVQVESDHASAFLAERGELSAAKKKYLWH